MSAFPPVTSTVPGLAEAGAKLSEDLMRYAGPRDWYAVGLCEGPGEPHLILYTTTRHRANELLAFIGYREGAFKVVGHAIGRVTLLSR